MTNPIHPPPGFEIRKLERQHIPWAQAILAHSNIFRSPVWASMYPASQTARCYEFFSALESLVSLNIASGLSYGIFATSYPFSSPESASLGGRLLWDLSNLAATADDLTSQMDFPLVSIALSYDGFEPRDGSEWKAPISVIPRLATLFAQVGAGDTRDPASWKPTAYNQVLIRGGTATREDFGGKGLAKILAHWLAYEMASMGFTAMQIGSAHPAVRNIFLGVPNPPFKAEVVSQWIAREYEEQEEGGKVVRPFAACGDVPLVKIWVTLK